MDTSSLAASAAATSTAAAPADSGSSTATPASTSGSFELTPLYGCEGIYHTAVASLLRLDDYTILLDCGWDERWDESIITAALRPHIPDIDLVIISHPDIEHLGALPYVVGKLGLSVPILATLPVWRMGQMFMYAAWMERWGASITSGGKAADASASMPPPFTLDHIDRAFDQIRQMKYSETMRLTDKGAGIEITPSCAGHLLGGAFWHIKKEAESLIYAVDFNHAGERHLNGALLNAPQFHRPSALITDASNVLSIAAKRSQQDQALCQTVSSRLRAGGCVLMPVDAAGRVLELLLVLHGLWATQSLHVSYPLVFLSPQSRNVVDFARSMLEWMTEKCRKMFDTNKMNPFAFPHLRLATTKEEVDALPKPYCLLATSATLEMSFAQDLLCQLSADPRNLLLLTQKAASWSVAGQLFEMDQKRVLEYFSKGVGAGGSAALKNPLPKTITFHRQRRVRLEGEELRAYREEKRKERERAAVESEKIFASSVDDAEAGEEDEDEEDDGMIVDSGLRMDGLVRSTSKGFGGAGTTGEGRRAKIQPQLYPLFPYTESRPKAVIDLWGEGLSADELRAITGASASGGGSGSKHGNGVGGGSSGYGVRMLGSDGRGRSDAIKSENDDVGMNDVPMNGEKEETAPYKTIDETVTLPLACSVQYIDFEGRSDGRSIKTVIKDVLPRKLIILTGSTEAKEHLRQHCMKNKICKEVLLPASNELVSVARDARVYRFQLKDSLLSSLQFVPLSEDLEVAYAEAQVKTNPAQAHLPLLQQATTTKGHPAVFLGQIKPSELQQIVQSEGIECELVGGVLVCCGGMVNVRKVSATQISIQGALCDEYYRIRDVLYEQFQIV